MGCKNWILLIQSQLKNNSCPVYIPNAHFCNDDDFSIYDIANKQTSHGRVPKS